MAPQIANAPAPGDATIQGPSTLEASFQMGAAIDGGIAVKALFEAGGREVGALSFNLTKSGLSAVPYSARGLRLFQAATRQLYGIKSADDWAKLEGVAWSKVVKPEINAISNKGLQNTVKELYGEGARVGNGSTADAVRFERLTGKQVGNKWHTQKAEERLTQLSRIMKDGNLSESDRSIARSLVDDLKSSLEKTR